MSKYKCSICGHIYDDAVEDIPFVELPDNWICPKCGVPKSMFKKIEEESKVETKEKEEVKSTEPTSLENYLKAYKNNNVNEEWVKDIHTMAKTGETIISPMATKKSLVSWEDILILGAQLNPMPLDEHDEVDLKTVIGKNAKKPMVIESPVFISHM